MRARVYLEATEVEKWQWMGDFAVFNDTGNSDASLDVQTAADH